MCLLARCAQMRMKTFWVRFRPRVGEDYLSVSWCEYFEGTFDEQLRCSIESIRNSKMSVKPKACFCVADTRDLLPCIENFGGIGRAVYHPEDDSHAHAGVYGVGAEELELLSYLADEEWNTYLTKQDADNLPLSACGKSPDVA